MRRLAIFFILAGAATVAAGCKSDNAAQAPNKAETSSANAPASEPQAAAPAPAEDSRPLIVCFGDSLTAGYGTDPGESYPDYLQADLDAEGYHYRVVNEGISGNTTKDSVERVDAIVAMKPAVVIVEFGGN